MALEDLLDWLDRRFCCGTLVLEHAAVRRSFRIDSGYLIGGRSDDPCEQLGPLLRARQLAEDHALDQALAAQAETGVQLGRILVMTGIVAEDTMKAVLEAKLAETLADAVSLESGSFTFDERVGGDPLSELLVSVNLRGVIDEGRGRRDEWRKLRETFPTDATRLWVRDRSALIPDSFSSAAKASRAALADHIDAGNSVAEIALAIAQTRYDTYRMLATLIDRGALAVERRTHKRSTDATLSELLARARALADRGERIEALTVVAEADHRAPGDPAIVVLRADIERALLAELSRHLLARYQVPRRATGAIERETLTKAEAYVFDRVDGRWDLLSLMRSSSLRHVETLLALHQLERRGYIAFDA